MDFLFENLIDNQYVTLTGSSEAAGFPASNLKNPHRTKVWQASAGPCSVVVDMSALFQATAGAELITNGAFTSNVNGWTPVDCTLASIAGGVAGNCLQITRTGEAEQYAGQMITGLTIGQLYKLTAYVKSGTSGNEDYALIAVWGGPPVSSESVVGTSSGSWVLATLYFTAKATSVTVGVLKGTATAGTMLFDTVSLYQMSSTNGYADMGIEGIALTGYDLGAAPATLQIEFNNYDVWTSPADTETLTWASLITPGYNRGSIIKKLAYEHCFRFARLNCSEAIALGRLYLGPVFTPERKYGREYTEEVVDPSLISSSIGGQDHSDELEHYRMIACNGIFNTQAAWALFQKMINSVGKTRPLFAAFDYTDEAVERTLYGYFDKLPAAQGSQKKYMLNYDFRFREAR